MDHGDESLDHNGRTVGVVSTDVWASSDYAKFIQKPSTGLVLRPDFITWGLCDMGEAFIKWE